MEVSKVLESFPRPVTGGVLCHLCPPPAFDGFFDCEDMGRREPSRMHTTDDRDERLELEEFPAAPEALEDELAALRLVQLIFGLAAFIWPSNVMAAFSLVKA